MFERVGAFFRHRFSDWVYRRLPPARSVTLSNRSLFIFPSPAGFSFLLLILLCWLVATNYENNIVFAITCLLTAIFVVAILHSFANLSGITVHFVRAIPAFAGENLVIEVSLSQNHLRYREGLNCSFNGGEVSVTTLGEQEETRVEILQQALKRGFYDPGRLTLESVYPLGLLRVWTKLDLDIQCLVYPKPIFIANAGEVDRSSGSGEGPFHAGEGSEDFVGLNDYQPGDSLKRVAWKHYAREQGMYAKSYADYQDDRVWLDWASYPGLDQEARLSRLCGQLLQVSDSGKPYGLRLPGLELEPDNSEAHKLKLLRELALFGDPKGSQRDGGKS